MWAHRPNKWYQSARLDGVMQQRGGAEIQRAQVRMGALKLQRSIGMSSHCRDRNAQVQATNFWEGTRSIDLLRAVTRSRQTERMLEIREARSLLMYKAFRLCAGIRGRSLDGDGRCKRSIAEEI